MMLFSGKTGSADRSIISEKNMISKIFASYAVWYHNGAKETLERWFGHEIWTD